jgi:hypothetical protein
MSEVNEVEREVGRFQKNALSEIRARLVKVHGRPCADVRMFAVKSQGEMVPTKAGLCLSREKLPELRALVNRLVAACGPQEGDAEADGHEEPATE